MDTTENMASTDDSARTRVFISYSHDSTAHTERVLALADRLNREGLDCELDQYQESPPEGWPQWMDRQLDQADYVLVVCTETYLCRAKGEEPQGVGRSVKWEATLSYQHLYDADSLNTRFIPVLFDVTDKGFIPKPLGGASWYLQAVLRDGLDEEVQRLWVKRMIAAVNQAFPKVEFDNWPTCERLVPQAQASAGLIEQWGIETEVAARLLNGAGYYLNERARYAEADAEPLYQRSLGIREKALGPDHPDVAASLNNLAELYPRRCSRCQSCLAGRSRYPDSGGFRGGEGAWCLVGRATGTLPPFSVLSFPVSELCGNHRKLCGNNERDPVHVFCAPFRFDKNHYHV